MPGKVVRHFRFPGRFEWKILAAVFVVAILTLLATGYFLSRTLATLAAVNTRHQREVRDSLGKALEAYRFTFADEKELFRARADALSGKPLARAAELANVPDLLRARILEGNVVVDEWSVATVELERSREAPPNLVELPSSDAFGRRHAATAGAHLRHRPPALRQFPGATSSRGEGA